MTVQNEGMIPPLAYSFDSLSLATSINTTQLRADAKSGKLKGRRNGKRWIFLPEDANNYLKSLPLSKPSLPLSEQVAEKLSKAEDEILEEDDSEETEAEELEEE